MKALMINKIVDLQSNREPLRAAEVPVPEPTGNEVRIKVLVCGVCHTELDEIEGRCPPPFLPIVPGHQVVGMIDKIGPDVVTRKVGDRVGVAWIYSCCEQCSFCTSGNENLCPEFKATGRDVNGGYAEFMVAPEYSTYLIPDNMTSTEAAPMLCAGAIGYRSLQFTQLRNKSPLGLTGFGASAHLVLMLARYQFPDIPVYVFARSKRERDFALELGAAWVGESHERAPLPMQAIIDTTPVWTTVVKALRQLEPGGRMIINAIRKEPYDREQLALIDYEKDIWMEKCIQSVANVTRQDVRMFLSFCAENPIKPTVVEYPLSQANTALSELKEGKIRGAKVVRILSEEQCAMTT